MACKGKIVEIKGQGIGESGGIAATEKPGSLAAITIRQKPAIAIRFITCLPDYS